MTQKPWYVYGIGGLGIETMDILIDMLATSTDGSWHCCFLIDVPGPTSFMGREVVQWSECNCLANVTIAVGEPDARAQLAQKCSSKGLTLSTVVSPRAFVSPFAKIENGVIVAPFSSIQADACLGPNVAINTQAIVGHHVKVKRDSVISSQANIGGAAIVGERAYVGMGSLIKEKVAIGADTIVGMGSVVYRDLPECVIAVGNPARPAKRNEEKKVFK